MRCTANQCCPGILAAVLLAAAFGAAAAEGDADTDTDAGWRDTAELGAVLTHGNSENTTVGFKNKLWREWETSTVTLKLGGIKTDSTTFTRTAIGTPDNIVETAVEETTAENYYLSGRYDHRIHERMFWYSGLGWDRNEFAGIDNRYIAEGGVGNIWFDKEAMKFSTAYAATFTKQEDVVQLSASSDTFVGVRLSWEYENKLTKTTIYDNNLIVDFNLDETDDWRVDMVNGLAVAINGRVALKLTLRLLYDNEPSFELLDIQMPVDPLVTTVPFQLDDLDAILTASLVVNF